MKTIKLTQEQITIVSDEDYNYLSQWKWYAHKKNNTYYAVRVQYIPFTKRIYMHRVIAKTPDNLVTDHINHNTLDNRRENLRNVTNLQNQMNRRSNLNSKLKEKNISQTPSGTFRVHVRLQGKTVFRKTFKSLSEAISVRDIIQEKYHGEFRYREDY